MERRDFLRKTAGAALAGVLAPLLPLKTEPDPHTLTRIEGFEWSEIDPAIATVGEARLIARGSIEAGDWLKSNGDGTVSKCPGIAHDLLDDRFGYALEPAENGRVVIAL
jgi:hypothetical protein